MEPTPSRSGIESAAVGLRERGYAVFENTFTDEQVALLRGPLARRYSELGSPTTYANPPLEPARDVEISRVGLVYHKLIGHFPELATRLLEPRVVSAIRELLGDDMYLEYTSAVVCNDARPFFRWHMHVGGVDNVTYRKQLIFPTFERAERVATLLYLDDLTDEAGTLLVYPRAISDPTHPPFDPEAVDWLGQVELRCSRGTVVVLDQCTWHAARPKRSPGLRAFIACYFTSSHAARTSWIDDSFHPWAAGDPLLTSVVPRSSV